MKIGRFRFQLSNKKGSGISTRNKGETKFSSGVLEPTSSMQSKSAAALWRPKTNMPRKFTTIQESISTPKGSSAPLENAMASTGKRRCTPGGPISEGIARAIEEGYSSRSEPYHGYFFKILKGQGPAARLGQLEYVVNGIMIGGFALVAVPADYQVTGVKTFMVSYDGVVYEKDLGPDSLKLAKNMERYNPDKTWHRTDDQWPTDSLASVE